MIRVPSDTPGAIVALTKAQRTKLDVDVGGFVTVAHGDEMFEAEVRKAARANVASQDRLGTGRVKKAGASVDVKLDA